MLMLRTSGAPLKLNQRFPASNYEYMGNYIPSEIDVATPRQFEAQLLGSGCKLACLGSGAR
jgi:hypothetical protein